MTASKIRGILTASRMSSWLSCQQRHEYSYGLGWRSAGSAAMRVGSMFHAVVEEFWRRVQAAQPAEGFEPFELEPFPLASFLPAPRDEEEAFLVAEVETMVGAYVAHWSAALFSPIPYRVLAVEHEFRIPLIREKAGRKYRTRHPAFDLGGKIDLVLRDDSGRVWVVEHKTTSRDISAGSSYWENTVQNHQLSAYLYAVAVEWGRVDGFIFDVTRRPSLERLRATDPEKRKFRKRSAAELSEGLEEDSPGLLYAAQRLEDERLDAYSERLRLWGHLEVVAAMRSPFAPARIGHFLRSANVVADQVRAADSSGAFSRNTAECLNHGRCPYFSACAFDVPLAEIAGLALSSSVNPELSEGVKNA